MHITIRIIYKGYSSRLMQRGSFPVNMQHFNENPDQEAARVAHIWLRQIQREIHVAEIIQVVYDDEREITQKVKELNL